MHHLDYAKIYDVVLLTEARYLNPKTKTDYIQNVLTEDSLVANALKNQGLRVHRADWADPNFDWKSTKYALFRTTWDYFHKYEQFSEWLDQVSQETTLINPASLIRWNVDKHYLQDLAKKGIHIPATRFVEKGAQTSLETLHQETGWQETVLKPAISGAARHTYRLNIDNLAEHEAIFQELIAQEAMLLQAFQHQVLTKGEVAFMVFGGKFSHAILKKAKKGDFRVQDDFGGTVHEYEASPQEIAYAESVVAACSPQPLYARVDVIWDNQNQLALSELELIEPELWFRYHQPAADQLAEAVAKFLGSK